MVGVYVGQPPGGEDLLGTNPIITIPLEAHHRLRVEREPCIRGDIIEPNELVLGTHLVDWGMIEAALSVIGKLSTNHSVTKSRSAMLLGSLDLGARDVRGGQDVPDFVDGRRAFRCGKPFLALALRSFLP